MKNKCSVVRVLLGCVIVFMSFAFCTKGEAKSEKDTIRDVIAGELKENERVAKICYTDYDRNGRKEAFVLTGPRKLSKLKEDPHTVWFAYVENGNVVKKQISKEAIIDSRILKLNSVSLFALEWYVTTSRPQDIYCVQGNEVKKIFTGNSMQVIGGDDLTSVHSTYDFMWDPYIKSKYGHTWKPYYFTYRDGKIKQYTAKKISKKQLKKYINGEAILKKYQKKGTIQSILYRSNGIVHINYVIKQKKEGYRYYFNVSFRVKGKKLAGKKEEEGSYKKKL